MVKIRLQGLSEDIQKTLKDLEKTFDVLAISGKYANRNSQYVRVYVEVKNKKGEF